MFAREIPIETGVTVERDGFVFTDLVPRWAAAGAAR